MTLYQRHSALVHKQLAFREGISLLDDAMRELSRNAADAKWWSDCDVLANAMLIPLNVIVNAFELKKAQSIYILLATAIYQKFSASGSRADGDLATLIGLFKKFVLNELQVKGVAELVPGVNVLIGMAQDFSAVMQAVTHSRSAGAELSALRHSLETRLAAMHHELRRLGIERSEVLSLAGKAGRTA